MKKNKLLGKWSVPGVPHTGWTELFVVDLEEPSQICEMCEFQIIRYVHTVVHPDYPDTLEVGCDCAEHLTGSGLPTQLERQLKNRANRKKNWCNKWSQSEKGNWSVKVSDRRFTVMQSRFNSSYGYCLNGNWTFGFARQADAMLAVFDQLYPARLQPRLESH